jgi:predicted SnoaL-like aldol condensation-catalyzing enzyme
MFRATFARTTELAVDVFRRVENEKIQNLWDILLADIVAVMKPDDIDGTARIRKR